MADTTENIRRETIKELNAEPPTTREGYEALYGKVWDTGELQEDFRVLGFLAPFVVVERKSDGVKGSLTFTHSPRFYFDFKEDK